VAAFLPLSYPSRIPDVWKHTSAIRRRWRSRTRANSLVRVMDKKGDGRSYRIVKVPHRAAELQQRLRGLGWDITVTSTAGPFYWGAGSRG
jgi:hypothetical protein